MKYLINNLSREQFNNLTNYHLKLNWAQERRPMTHQHRGIPHQTKLLIMAFLGMAYSALYWKPFGLMVRLNLVRDLQLSFDNERFGNTFTSAIKQLIGATVIMEFICGLAGPFAELLKLYSVITMSRSDILLPWLVIHALNSLLPKILDIGYAVLFYYERIISSSALFEFLLVESVNFLVAGYNWYVFLDFYQDIRELEHRRKCRKTGGKITCCSSVLPGACTSSPNVSEAQSESSTSFDKELRFVKSLVTFVYNDDKDSVTLDNWSESSFIEKNLTPAEKTIRYLKLSPEQVEEARKRRREKRSKSMINYFDENLLSNLNSEEESSESSESEDSMKTETILMKRDTAELPGRSFSEIRNTCACSSSEDDEENDQSDSKKFRTDPMKESGGIEIKSSQNSVHTKRKIHADKKPKRVNRNSSAIKNLDKSSCDSLALSKTMLNFKKGLHKPNDNLSFLLDKNFQLLDKMCKSINMKNRNIIKNNSQKWWVFQHKLESTLNGNLFSKESNFSVDINKLQKSEHSPVVKSTINELSEKTEKYSGLKCNENLVKPIDKSHDGNVTKAEVAHFVDINPLLTTNPYQKKCIQSHPIFTSGTSQNTVLDYSKCGTSNFSVLKTSKMMKWTDCKEDEKIRELRNLQVYNNLTLEMDRHELLQKKKKSKMTASKMPRTDHKSTLTFTQEQKNSEYNSLLLDETEISNDTKIATTSPARKLEIENLDHPVTKFHSSIIAKNSDNIEIKIIKPINAEDTTSLVSINIPIRNNVAAKPASMRETIEGLDWSTRPTSSHHPEEQGSKSESCSRIVESRPLADDETLSLLQSAFSFSDESERGFRLGPEASEPYPVYQAFALTVAEVFKATGWRDFERALPALSPPDELESSEDLTITTVASESIQPMDYSVDELERRKNLAARLLEQFQELMDSSRETLSAIESARHGNVEGARISASKENLFFNNTLEYMTAFKDISNQEKKIQSDIVALNMYVDTMNGMASTSREGIQELRSNSALQHHNNLYFKNNHETKDVDDSNDWKKFLNDEHAEQEIQEKLTSCNKVCPTKFENNLRVHRLKAGEGLSSGNVMQLDSEVCDLSLIKSRNLSFAKYAGAEVSKLATSKNEVSSCSANFSHEINCVNGDTEFSEQNVSNDASDDNLVKIFDSFYKKVENKLEHSTNDKDKVQRKLEKLAKTNNFTQFMSLFGNPNSKVNYYQNAEVEINNSDLQNKEAEASNFQLSNIEKAQIEETISEKNKDTLQLFSQVPISEHKTNIKTQSQVILENYRKKLKSDIIKERIASWNKDSMESLSVLGGECSWKYAEKGISDESDMEEFTM